MGAGEGPTLGTPRARPPSQAGHQVVARRCLHCVPRHWSANALNERTAHLQTPTYQRAPRSSRSLRAGIPTAAISVGAQVGPDGALVADSVEVVPTNVAPARRLTYIDADDIFEHCSQEEEGELFELLQVGLPLGLRKGGPLPPIGTLANAAPPPHPTPPPPHTHTHTHRPASSHAQPVPKACAATDDFQSIRHVSLFPHPALVPAAHRLHSCGGSTGWPAGPPRS